MSVQLHSLQHKHRLCDKAGAFQFLEDASKLSEQSIYPVKWEYIYSYSPMFITVWRKSSCPECEMWDYDLKLNYQSNDVKSSSNTKFLGLIIDDSLSWKAHIDQMMSKLHTACFVIRSIQATETLRMVYFAYQHSIMRYGIFFGEINHIVTRF